MRSPDIAFGLAAMLSLPLLYASGAAEPGSQAFVNLEVTALPGHAIFSEHEPILVSLRFRNVSDHPLSIVLARSPLGTLFYMTLTITRPDGTQVVRELEEEADSMFMPGAVSLAPGVEVVFDQTLNEWDGFRDQGQYRITAAIPLTPDKQFISRTAPRINVAFNVVVGPRNPDQVKETCEQLAAKATARNALAAVEASHALRYATDAACVPALARALAQFSMIVKLEALRGLAGVGTPDAAAAVAGEWDHLDDSEKASAFRWFGFSGSEALLRTALAARRGGIK